MLFQVAVWILAIYGLIEIVISAFKFIVFMNNNVKDMYILIAVKNQENTIEGIIRSIVFKNIYHRNESLFNNIIIADMGSTDETLNILKKLAGEYSFLRILDGKASQDVLDTILGSER